MRRKIAGAMVAVAIFAAGILVPLSIPSTQAPVRPDPGDRVVRSGSVGGAPADGRFGGGSDRDERRVSEASPKPAPLEVILDGARGEPLVRANLVACPIDANRPASIPYFWGVLFRAVRTGEDGAISIEPVPPGSYRVSARLGSVRSKEERVAVEAGAVVRLFLCLPR